MRSNLSLVATFILAGCGTSGAESLSTATGAGGRGPFGDGGLGSNDSGGSNAAGSSNGGGTEAPQSGAAVQLVAGPASIVGVTSDGWAVFRDPDALRAVKLGAHPAVEEITRQPGSVLIRGKVVFNWADVDWTSNLGDLSVWSSEAGTHEIGAALYTEGLVAVSEQGSTIVYAANALEQTVDLMLAPTDLSSPQVLIESMGRGTEATCGASLGFVGERLIVGWCEAGSRVGQIERYEQVGEEWQSTPIASDALPEWSADSGAERVFYKSSAYGGYCAYDGESRLVDAGVGRGLVLPDGSAVLYTVGDQLRRATLPEGNPIPIVTRGYGAPVEFSPGFDVSLYSTSVTYDNGTRRDLKLVHTDGFNPTPIELVTEPVAALPRSSMTQDGRFVLYLTDMTPSGASLHVVAVDGSELLLLPNVVEAVAANGSTLVFTDNSSDPSQYPVVSDLKVIDVATDAQPRLIEASITEGRNFQLDLAKEKVVYQRSGVDRDPLVAERDGLFFQWIR